MYFAHLHVHSHYSLLDGMSKIDELLDLTKKMGLEAIALTDHGVLYGAIEFYTKAKERGIKPIVGCEVYLAPRSRNDKVAKVDAKFYHLTLLVKNQIGYQNLIKLVTIGELEGFYYKPRVDKETLRKYSEGLIALSSCLRGEIPQALLAKDFVKAKELAQEYQNIFGKDNFYLELQDHQELEEQNKVNEGLLKLSEETKIPAVVTCDSHYPLKGDKRVHEVLLAVQTGSDVESEDRLTMARTDFHLKEPKEVINNFQNYPELFENIKKIVDACNLEIDLNKLIFPKFQTPSNEPSFEYLERLSRENFVQFYDEHNKEARARLEHELEVIKKTNFSDYFLVIYDIIRFAREEGILTNTRGSAAGSLVAYVLGITHIDPMEYDLYFERFLNPERLEPPDIDLDVADDRRQEIIVYISEKYGQDHVAQVLTFGIMKSRSAVRDVNRALGHPYSLGDQIAKLIPQNLPIKEALKTISEFRAIYETNDEAREVIDIAQRLEGVARHASTHAAGIVITSEPIVNFVPLQHSSRSENDIVTQYEMHSLNSIGLVKIDILGLANLTVVKNTLRIIKKVYGEDLDLDSLGFEDSKVYKLLSKGETVGVFQVESEGMRHYLKDLKPNSLEDIIAMLALYRPGPMELIPQFIKRKHGEEKITYFHPDLKPILEKTYGIMVYQEQLMKIAHDLAGFSMAEADVLRKAVGKKIKSLLSSQKEKMIGGMMKREIKKEIAERIWEWVEPFARYGFNKGHSSSYARITYQTAWLKACYPSAFMAALLTSDFGNLDRIAIEIKECERMGIKVIPPSVNQSFVEFGTDKETGNIPFGLSAIKNVGTGVAEMIQIERQQNGQFANLINFFKRIPRQVLNRKTLESLIKSGALDCFGSRELMVDNLDKILEWSYSVNNHNNLQMGLFKEDSDDIVSHLGQNPPLDKTKRLIWEREYLGIYLTGHPLDDYKGILGKIALTVSQLDHLYLGKRIKVCGFISRIQRVRTKIGKPMVFTQISDYDHSIDVVLYPTVLANYTESLSQDKVILVEGRMDRRNGEYQIIGEKIEEIKPMEA
ncbi:MAG: DNA polymerase III subunit alpha [Candidatus Paceibacterota bacterium]|jgi:DNA polymerase-3 subunit alpha